MKAIGYAICCECGDLVAGYAPRGWKAGDALHIWKHVHGSSQLGWGRQAKCPGSYRAGQQSRLNEDLTGNAELQEKGR